MNRDATIRSSVFAALTTVVPVIAYGQATPPPSESGGLAEVVVTAERQSGNLQTTPIAVSAFDDTRLDDLHINRPEDLARSVPSLWIAPGTVDPTTLTVFMRGAGQNAGTWVASESAVGLYIDDLYFARLTGANLDLADIERIEVLRGPQGTLYGRNTLVGAIKYVTRKPSATPYGRVELEYGRYDLARVKATYSAPFSDRWAGLITGSYYSRDGFTTALARGGETLGQRDEHGVRAAIGYIGDGPFGLDASAFYSRATNDGMQLMATNPVTLVPASSDFYSNVSPVKPSGRNETYGGDLTVSWKLSAVTFKSITGFIGSTEAVLADTTGGRTTRGPAGEYLIGFDRLTTSAGQHQFTQELQALGSALGDRLQYIGGVYYFKESGTQDRTDFVLASINLLPQSVRSTTDSYAGFAQVTYKFTDALSAVAGLRYTQEKKTVKGRTQNGVFTVPQAYAAIDAETKANATTPKVGLNWQIAPDHFAYVSASRGFQSGGFNFLALANPIGFQTSYKPQTVWTYETGVKSEFLNRRLRINAAYYYNDFTDIQTNVVIPQGSGLTQNAGEAVVQGVEVEFQAVPAEPLEVYGSLTWSNDRYVRLNPTSDPAVARARRLPNVPKWQTLLGAKLNVNVSSGANPRRLVFGADHSYTAEKYVGSTNAPITRMAARGLVNASIAFEPVDGRWSVGVRADNVFGKEYFYYGNVLAGTFGVRAPAEPRIVRVVGRYQF